MKSLNTTTYAIFFAGCYLGAGFVSGNELTQFFGNFGLSVIHYNIMPFGALGQLGAVGEPSCPLIGGK